MRDHMEQTHRYNHSWQGMMLSIPTGGDHAIVFACLTPVDLHVQPYQK